MAERANATVADFRKKDPASIEYRRYLLNCEQKSQEDFDKTLVALSGGALAISFAFTENFIKEPGPVEPYTLFGAWLCWSASLLAVFASFYFSVQAHRLTVKQFDGGEDCSTPGGEYSTRVEVANKLGAALFLFGLLIMFRFVYVNL